MGVSSPLRLVSGARGRCRTPFHSSRGVGRNVKDGGGVAEIHAHRRLGHVGAPAGSQSPHREVAGSRGVDHEVRAQCLRPAGALQLHARDRGAVVRREEPEDTTAGLDADAVHRLDPPAHAVFELRPRDSRREEPEVALREGIVAGSFDEEIEPRSYADGSDAIELVVESRKQLFEDTLAACEEHVQVLALRHARAGVGAPVEGVALEDRDMVEEIREHARRREAAHAAANDDRLATQSARSDHGALRRAFAPRGRATILAIRR